jgi:hypothetical protein
MTSCGGKETLAYSDVTEFIPMAGSQWYTRCWVASAALRPLNTTSSWLMRMATKSLTSCIHHGCPLTHQLRLIRKAFKLVGHCPLVGGGTASGRRPKRKPQLAWKSEPFKQTIVPHIELLTTGLTSVVALRTVQVRVAIHDSHGNLLFTHIRLIDWASTPEVYRNSVTIVSTQTMQP